MVLTGYNTDIEHAGTTYHVQTEDKGSSNPFVESLVYASGEILYSRRTPYHDLVAQDVDRSAVAAIMERQHRSIVEAIGSGRLDQLMAKDEEVASDEDTTIVHPPAASPASSEQSLDEVILGYLEAQRGQAHLILRATTEHDFVYGEKANISVIAVDSQTTTPQPAVEITVMFKSTAEPRRVVLARGATGVTGEFDVEADVPRYNGGTSAVVISAESELGQSEIKHLVHR